MSKRNLWIVKTDDGWALKKERTPQPISNHRTQANAVKSGIPLAKKDGVDLIVQGRNHKIQSRDSYGNDPCPPKDKEH